MYLDAYNSSNTLLAEAGPAASNVDTGTMDQLLVTRATPDVAYVIVHDTGNYFAVDSVCTDAAGTSTTPVGGSVGDQMSGNPSMKPVQCQSGPTPVNCASGDFWHTFTDLSVPGRGVPLDLTRTYNSALTSTASTFGYGWSSSYGMSLAVNGGTGDVTVTQEDGTTDIFEPNGSGGYTTLPSIFATLVQNGNGTYTFTRHSTQIFTFSSSGQLLSESDPNGYVTSLAYNGSNQLTSVTDPAGRSLSFSYGGNGLVSEMTGPGGQSVSYSYDGSGNLTSVTDVGGGVTSFTDDSAHLLLTMTNPNGQSGGPDAGDKLTNTYTSGQVTEQVDPMGRATYYSYSGDNLSSSGGSTTITDPNGDVTVEEYVNGELISLTKGYGTPTAATWDYAYDPATLGITRVVDPDGNVTTYTYDSLGDVLTNTDALGHTWTYTYNSLGEVLTSQTPDQAEAGVETTNGYNADGNLTATATTLPGGGEALTTYTYGDPSEPGDVTAVTNPDGHTTNYAYDAFGDLTDVVDPLGRATTYTYNVLGEKTSMVSPGQNPAGAGLAPGDIYTLGDGTLDYPDGVSFDSSGNMYIADSSNNTVEEVPVSSGTQWGVTMTAGQPSTIVGTGTAGTSANGTLDTSALLDSPTGSPSTLPATST